MSRICPMTIHHDPCPKGSLRLNSCGQPQWWLMPHFHAREPFWREYRCIIRCYTNRKQIYYTIFQNTRLIPTRSLSATSHFRNSWVVYFAITRKQALARCWKTIMLGNTALKSSSKCSFRFWRVCAFFFSDLAMELSWFESSAASPIRSAGFFSRQLLIRFFSRPGISGL